MFSEELRGNATRKRQEEARVRRRQLKQQQEKKQQPNNLANVEAPLTKNNGSLRNPAVPLSGHAPVTLAVSSILTDTTKTATKPAAVAAALEQRQLRQEQQQKQRAAVVIQSMYRSHYSNCTALNDQASQLSQRLKDLETLRVLIHKKTAVEYIPPPATATVLVRQLLFVTKSRSYLKKGTHTKICSPDDLLRLRQVLEYVLLPGILGKDDNLDPLFTWTEGVEGQVRLMELLRLCFVAFTFGSPQPSPDTLTIIDAFLRSVLGISATTSARGVTVDQCRVILPSITALDSVYIPPVDKKNTRPLPYAITGSSLDLVGLLRYHLLFARGEPIPKDAVKRRECCITEKQREQNAALFQLTLDAIQSATTGSERRRLQSRFVSEILTVPLLTWKVSMACIFKLAMSDRPLIITMVQSFIEQHSSLLYAGKVASILPTADVPMTSCPATNVQCLLASLVQIGRICPSTNGSDPPKTNYQAAALLFDLIAALVDVVPLSTFSSRESAVEWITDGKMHHTPIVLSPVVIEECKLLLLDSFVRNLFNCAIDNNALGTENVLNTKNDTDRKLEKDLAEVRTSSAASLAAKEARVDRSKRFWQSSTWSRKLSSGVSSMLSGVDAIRTTSTRASSRARGHESGVLMDTSLVSRKLAHGIDPHDRMVKSAVLANSEAKEKAQRNGSDSVQVRKVEYDPCFFFSLCRAFGIVLARWGGGGRDDIVNRAVTNDPLRFRDNEYKKMEATSSACRCTLAVLNVLCFSTTAVQTAWALSQSDSVVISNLYSVIDRERSPVPVRSLSSRRTRDIDNSVGASVLLLFVCCLSHMLIVTDDVEIHEMDKPIPMHQLRRCIQLLKKLLHRACVHDVDDKQTIAESNYFGLALISFTSKTLRDLYDRSSRRPLCVPQLWIIDDLLGTDIKRCKTASQFEALLATPVLRVCPFLVSFKRRLKLFERIVTLNRIEIQGIYDQNPFSTGLKPGIPVRIMRTRLLEDGLATMNNLGKNMRQRIVVHYTNEAGRQEAGVDAGGLFKEFWTDLSQLAFDPNYALFRVTEGNCLYPNPSSFAAHGPDHVTLFEFLGRILGKALFEGITIHPQFAHFFLSFLRGEYDFLHMLPDLFTMDATLYNNLMFLKTYCGDAEDLCLTFAVADDDFGGNNEIELIQNGGEVAVTNSNKHRYIGLVAKHHVCDRVKEQSQAFCRGLWEVIDRSWLRIFNEPELQVLISGPSDGKIDISDLRSHTRYVGGYTAIDTTIRRFWNAVESFNSKQQADLLRFVTSCERPPPLGFSSMNPQFTIQRVSGLIRVDDKLPTASTCFNVLKLPTYSSEKVLRQRLLYAIESGSGFELT